jgi:RimJ/RimL family protein N-acetyltransferase
MAPLSIAGTLVTLQTLQEQHFNDYLTMFSPTIRHMLHVPALENELNYLRDRLEKQQQNATHFFCIFDNELSKLVGALEIRDSEQHRGQLYCWVHEQFWGKGHYQEALALAAHAYFALTPHQFFTARVDVTNTRSYYALRKSGFAQAGICQGPYGKQYELVLRRKCTDYSPVFL